ncbi:bZIP transcription factor [Spirosoma sp. BT702]|uniref:BZIP transcription factor n=1 Tax=Spirosoma profusum TaxID=2771354 RepID=A0A927ARQ6_9BACT|nr:bZIP transcription factor [Spirosoma profusum]MBD2702703.1 bZIP transcription factor [Spirosoma profusum]
MKNVNFLHVLLLASPLLVNAQTNYVANTPNAVGPGLNNVLIGPQAGNATMTGPNNVYMGLQTGKSTTSGYFNTFVGWLAGKDNTSGFTNVFIGNQAGSFNTTGQSNLFLGSYAGERNTTGNYNMCIGNSAGQAMLSGNGNSFIGDGSGYGNVSGSNNTYIGEHAGFFGNASGNKNTFIGYRSGVTSTSTVVENSTAIGTYALTSTNNSIVLGGTGVYSVSVGIGNTAPKNTLEITSSQSNRSGLRFTNLKQATPASTLVDLGITLDLLNPLVKVLTVDANGDVKLVGLSLSLLSPLGLGREGVTSAGLWESKAGFAQNTNQEGVIIGNGITNTPKDYNLFVSKGILTEKVKVAVNGTSEWSDYVFDKSYKLKNLSAVESYIKANKHLPGIPSAQEMVEQGNDLHKTDAKLLAKIEELTLYMIEMKKDNQQLQRAVSNLKRQNKAINQKLKAVR